MIWQYTFTTKQLAAINMSQLSPLIYKLWLAGRDSDFKKHECTMWSSIIENAI